MNSKGKKIILLILIIIVAAIIFIANKKTNNNENKLEENNTEGFVQMLDNGIKLNISTKLNQEKEINGLKFKNIQLTEQNGQSVLLADVINTNEKATELTLVDIELLDKAGNEIITIGGIISPLQPGATTQFNTGVALDCTNVYDFKIIMK